MADTRSGQLHGHGHAHAQAVPAPPAPVEGDGVSYRGIIWFLVILAVTTLVCQGLMWGMLRWEIHRANAQDRPRPPMAEPAVHPELVQGRIDTGTATPAPALLVDEPTNLQLFRKQEEEALSTYGWIDKNAGTFRIPIDRAKELLLQRGLPIKGATPEPVQAKKGK
jgi:hypothetical protein